MQACTMRYLLAFAGIIGAVACADDRAVSPTIPGTTVAFTVAPAGCDLNLVKQDAKLYFASNKDPVYDLIAAMATLNKGTSFAAFKAKGFEVLARVGAVAGTADALTPAGGDTFVRDVLVCMGFTVPANTFTASLGDNGLFGVPSGTAPLLSRGSPTYGAEPKGTNTWESSLGQQVLFYGYPRDFLFSNEAPAAATAYELATVPSGLVFQQFIRVGVCQTTGGPVPRIQHSSEILSPEPPRFCGNPEPQSLSGQATGLLGFAHRLTDWMSPRPLYAAMVVGGMGGSLGGLSPIGAVQVDGSTVTLEFSTQPGDGSINKDIPTFTVKAKTANKTALDGVTVTLIVYGNNGTPIQISGNVKTTTNGGIATFDHFQTTKAGGYRITATGTFGGQNTGTALSELFNVNGQSP